MKLDRNENDGRGKYMLVMVRALDSYEGNGTFAPRYVEPVNTALQVLRDAGALDEGTAGTDSEFFVVRLKDRHAAYALSAYAKSAEEHGETEWAEEVRALATVAAQHPNKKQPD